MQNDLNQSLISAQNKQTIMVIGLQQAGKTTLVQKFKSINKKLIQESKISDYDIELIDTPTYDFFFTLLPFRDPKVTGYIIIFCDQNTDIMKSIKQIRKKLFTNNGQHKRTIIILNEYIKDNGSSEIQEEIMNIKYWCKQQDIIFCQLDVSRSSPKEILHVFEKMYMKRIRTTLKQKIFIILQFAVAMYVFLFAIWLSIKDPSLIVLSNNFCFRQVIFHWRSTAQHYYAQEFHKFSFHIFEQRIQILNALIEQTTFSQQVQNFQLFSYCYLSNNPDYCLHVLYAAILPNNVYTFHVQFSSLHIFYILFMKSYCYQDQKMIIYTKMLNLNQYDK
ncbi:unnamed protein product [Paramecium octaurelia]|uniref:Uncharacterized protein n=1 Tax=Paramecium octaurelia TaxID=43137 RepID=A0A8S1S2R8_PAROT|nr:unnamed protein product [Paramecium octaurelia]